MNTAGCFHFSLFDHFGDVVCSVHPSEVSTTRSSSAAFGLPSCTCSKGQSKVTENAKEIKVFYSKFADLLVTTAYIFPYFVADLAILELRAATQRFARAHELPREKAIMMPVPTFAQILQRYVAICKYGLGVSSVSPFRLPLSPFRLTDVKVSQRRSIKSHASAASNFSNISLGGSNSLLGPGVEPEGSPGKGLDYLAATALCDVAFILKCRAPMTLCYFASLRNQLLVLQTALNVPFFEEVKEEEFMDLSSFQGNEEEYEENSVGPSDENSDDDASERPNLAAAVHADTSDFPATASSVALRIDTTALQMRSSGSIDHLAAASSNEMSSPAQKSSASPLAANASPSSPTEGCMDPVTVKRISEALAGALKSVESAARLPSAAATAEDSRPASSQTDPGEKNATMSYSNSQRTVHSSVSKPGSADPSLNRAIGALFGLVGNEVDAMTKVLAIYDGTRSSNSHLACILTALQSKLLLLTSVDAGAPVWKQDIVGEGISPPLLSFLKAQARARLSLVLACMLDEVCIIQRNDFLHTMITFLLLFIWYMLMFYLCMYIVYA
jgi:hypothetical protein